MKKIIILLLCCGVLVSMVGCDGNTAPPPTESPLTTVSETIITEPPTETTPPKTAVEPTEKEKELPPTESKDQAAEPTAKTTEPTTTATEKPKEETKPTAKTKPTESSTTEVTEENTKTEATIREPAIEETVPPPEIDPLEIEKYVIEYINQYRTEQGDTTVTVLPGLTEVARYRAEQLITNFSHNSIPDACNVLQYGEFIDMTHYGGTAEDSYYRGYNREAIGKGDWFGTAVQMAKRIASGFRKSAGHWSYVGSSQYSYIAVGVIESDGKWYVCICMSMENYGG